MIKFGLIGYPLEHSFSPEYFKNKFQKEGLTNFDYTIYPLKDLNGFLEILHQNSDLAGLNVTTPYKEEILKYLHNKSDSVQTINACNCIEIQRINNNIILSGQNTDILGFEISLLRFINNNRPNALVFGNGGASKAVQFVLKKLGIDFLVVSQEKSKNTILYQEVSNRLIKEHPLLINTTILGMFPDINSKPLIDYSAVSSDHYLFDLVYNPGITSFMKEGLRVNAKVCNGFEMLQLQAEAAWKIWTKDLTF